MNIKNNMGNRVRQACCGNVNNNIDDLRVTKIEKENKRVSSYYGGGK